MTIGPGHFAVLGSLVFCIGLVGVLARRHPLTILMSLAVLFVGPVIALSGFAASGGGQVGPYGDAISVAALAVVAAHILCLCGVALVLWRRNQMDDVVELDRLRG